MALRQWLDRLLSPELPGMTPDSPRASLAWVGLLLGTIALLAAARLLLAPDQTWQIVDAAAGTVICALYLVRGQGLAGLLRLGGQTRGVVLGGNLLFSAYWYTGRVPAYRRWVAPHVSGGALAPLYPMLYLAAGSVLYRSVLPLVGAWLLWGLTPAQLGARRSRSDASAVRPLWPVYLALYLALLPVIAAASRTAAFRRRYPFYRGVVGPRGRIAPGCFALGQLAYLAIFASGEGFWRGVLLFGTERELGLYSLPFMVVPYVTAHYGKPLPETLGAVAAGTILGWLALKHRTFWLGVALHYAVALTMDLLAIRAHGFTLSTPSTKELLR